MVESADPAEAARLQQLQVAAAQWQQVQYHRAGYQYQALMQEHTQLQQILHRYQQVIQQPAHIQVDTCRGLWTCYYLPDFASHTVLVEF